MIATILNVAQEGVQIIVSFSIMDANQKYLNFGSFFNGIPCINSTFSLPLTATDVIDLESNINLSILTRLDSEFLNYAITNAITSILPQVSADLVGTSQAVKSLTVGSITINEDGSISGNQ